MPAIPGGRCCRFGPCRSGLALSTIAVGVTDAWTAGAHLAPPVHTMTLLFAHLSGFGILWVAQFILLDRVLFGRDAHYERKRRRLEVAGP